LGQPNKAPVGNVKLTSDEETTAAWVLKQGQTVELHDVAFAPQTSINARPRTVIRDTASSHKVRRYLSMIPLKTGQEVIGVMRLLIEDDPRVFARSIADKGLGLEREKAN
jgi:two-component system, OmpR family, sensor histidine kinase KdpD